MSITSISNNTTVRIAAVVVGVAVALSLGLGTLASPAKAQTAADLQAQIQSLLSTIAALQAQLNQVSGGTTTVGGGYTFSQDLTDGSTGTDVMNLQKFLNMSADTQVSASGAGSPGNETSYFGPATRAAVIKFQKKYGITPAVGYFGPLTRTKANSLGGGTTGTTPTTPTTPVAAGSVSVSAAAQPAASLAPKGANRVPFTKVTFTAGSSDVVVNSVTVERTGLAQDAAFSGVVLLDENGTQIGIAKTFNSNHQAAIGEPFTVRAGTSRTLTVAGNMASSLTDYTGQVASVAVVSVNTTASVSGSFPITGTGQTLNDTLTVGTVTTAISSLDPNSAQSRNIGDTSLKFSGVRVTAGSAEDLKLFSVRWRLNGSVSPSDMANIMTVVDGVSYPTTVSADGRYYSTVFSGGVLIQKGFSKDIVIQGDVIGVNASGRIAQFDIDKTSDLYLVGQTYGYGVSPAAGSSNVSTASTHGSAITSGTPWFQGSTFSISGGTATTIGKATEVAAQNVAVNVPNQVLGGFATDFKGEAVTVQGMTFTVASTTTGTASLGSDLLTNVTIVDQNGAVVAGPVDATDGTSADGSQTLTFTDSVTLPIGRTIYTLKGKVSSNARNGVTYTVSTTPSGWTNPVGQTTGNTVTISTGSFSMNVVTVRAGSLAVAASASPAQQTIVAGAQGVTFTNFQFDASQSGEDVRVSSIPTTLTASSNDEDLLTSCQLFDGSTALTTGSNVISPTEGDSSHTFSLDNSLVIPKGTVKEIAVKCNVSSSSSSDTFHWDITGSSITATGVTSGNTITPTGTGTGNTMTTGSGSLTVTDDASTPSYSIASGGSTNVVLGVYKFRATNEAVNLTRLGLQLSGTASSSASDLSSVTIWKDGAQVGSAVFVGSNTHATSTFSSPVVLAKDTDVALTIRGTIADIGTSAPATEGHLIKVDVDVNTNTQGTGVGSGTTVNATGSTSVSGVRIFKSYPTVSEDTLASTGVADGKLLRFKVTADAKGPVAIAKITVNVATTTATVTGINAYAFTDAGYSVPVSGLSSDGRLLATALTGADWVSSSTDLEIAAQTSGASATFIQVPAGSTRYFEVRGAVSGATSGAAITTTLRGDNAYPALASGYFVSSYADIHGGDTAVNNFVWSPMATTSSLTDGDWTNGNGVVGLPSGGITKTRSAN